MGENVGGTTSTSGQCMGGWVSGGYSAVAQCRNPDTHTRTRTRTYTHTLSLPPLLQSGICMPTWWRACGKASRSPAGEAGVLIVMVAVMMMIRGRSRRRWFVPFLFPTEGVVTWGRTDDLTRCSDLAFFRIPWYRVYSSILALVTITLIFHSSRVLVAFSRQRRTPMT